MLTAVPVRLADLGLTGACSVRDPWAEKEVGRVSGEFAPVVPWPGAGLYRIAKE